MKIWYIILRFFDIYCLGFSDYYFGNKYFLLLQTDCTV